MDKHPAYFTNAELDYLLKLLRQEDLEVDEEVEQALITQLSQLKESATLDDPEG